MNTKNQDPRFFEANNIAFTIWMIFFSMLFGVLFLYYALYRFRGTPWPPLGFETIPLLIPFVSSSLIVLSSFTVQKFLSSFKSSHKSGSTYYNLTFLLGILFLLSQNFLWKMLRDIGLTVDTGIFSSLIHAFTWVHAAHILLGLILLIYLRKFLKPSEYGKKENFQKVSQIVSFWHFLGFIWLLMFITLFLV